MLVILMSWGGPGPLSGAPPDSYVQLPACSVLQPVNCYYLLVDFCESLLPLLPQSPTPAFSGKYWLGKFSTD